MFQNFYNCINYSFGTSVIIILNQKKFFKLFTTNITILNISDFIIDKREVFIILIYKCMAINLIYKIIYIED